MNSKTNWYNICFVLYDRVECPDGKSIAVNGVSLTVVDSKPNQFKVAIIPYTFEHTSFKNLKKEGNVNLEFDILGKYLAKMALNYK